MKPSSPDAAAVQPDIPAPRPDVPAVRPDAGVVRSARLDRPIGRRLLDPAYADPALEELVAAATAKAQEYARAQGFAAGWAQGLRAARDQAAFDAQARAEQLAADRAVLAAQGRQLLAALADTAHRDRQGALPDWHEVADALTDGALALATAVLGRELSAVDAPIADAVRTILRALGDPEHVVIHVHPSDLPLLTELPPGVRLNPDPELEPGSVRAQTAEQRLIYDLPAALAAAREVLAS